MQPKEHVTRRPNGSMTPARDVENALDDQASIDHVHEVTRPHVAYLHDAAMRISGNREVANILVQEMLARAGFHFRHLTPGSNVKAWLVTILTRLYLDKLKHEKVVTNARRELALPEIIERDVDMTVPEVSDAMLWDAVQKLEPDLREVIELRYCKQQSFKEIADTLRVPVGTVGTRLGRAHHRLQVLVRSRVT